MKTLVLILLALGSSVFAQQAVSQVTIEWEPSPVPNITGYRLKYGTTKGGPYPLVLESQTATRQGVSNLNVGTTYYFVATAYIATASLNAESPPSNEVSFTPTDIPPLTNNHIVSSPMPAIPVKPTP